MTHATATPLCPLAGAHHYIPPLGDLAIGPMRLVGLDGGSCGRGTAKSKGPGQVSTGRGFTYEGGRCYLAVLPDFLGVVLVSAGLAGVDCALAAFAAVGLAAF